MVKAPDPDYPSLSEAFRVTRLAPPTHRMRLVMDADAYNEIDDQFAVAYGLLSPDHFQVEALNAAPFRRPPSLQHWGNVAHTPAEGMELSYAELQKILRLMGLDVPCYRGSTTYLPGPHEPVESEAARQLVELALAASADDPLYVAVMGCITNVASAILMEPRIIEQMVVVWLGGNGLHWPHTRVYNLNQDLHASRIIFDSGVPLVHIGCLGVVTQLHTTVPLMEAYLEGKGGPVTQYLLDIYRRPPYKTAEQAADPLRAKVLWDISTIAWMKHAAWLPSRLVPSPHITDYPRWAFDPTRHLIRDVYRVRREEALRDLFAVLTGEPA